MEKKRRVEETPVISSASVFMFNSKSAAVSPGKGAKETLRAGDSFPVLAKVPNWRRMLSAFHVTKKPLEFRGMQFATQEHAWHAAKFLGCEFHKWFALGHPTSPFCRDPVLAKSAGGKSGKVRAAVGQPLDGKKATKRVVFTRPKEFVMDATFLANARAIRLEIMRAKVKADPDVAEVLMGTGNAVLTHWTRGSAPPVVEEELMRVRDELVRSACAVERGRFLLQFLDT